MENTISGKEEELEEARIIGDPKEEFIRFLKTFKDIHGKLKYWDKVLDMTIKGERSITIDFPDLYITNPQLALYVVENPREALDYASQALKELVANENRELATKIERFYVRFRNLPETVPIRRLGSEHIEKLVQIEGVVTRMTPTMERLYKAVFQCTNCGTEVEVIQEGDTLEYPSESECACEGKPSFKLLLHKSKFIDVQKIMVQERPEEIPPGQLPRSIEVVLTEDLVDKARPGDRVTIVGILTIKGERSVKKGSKLTFEMRIEANNVEVSQKVLEELEISKEDERRILELAKDPKIREKIVESVAPAIYGYEHIKKAIALLLFGGIPKELPDGTRIRGDIHVLLVGDPGTAKSLVYSENILLMDENGVLYFKPIGEIVDTYMEKFKEDVVSHDGTEELPLDKVGVKLYTIAISPTTFEPEIKPIKALIRHKAPRKIIVLRTRSGRKAIITKNHSLIGLDEKLNILKPLKPYEALRKKALLPVLKNLSHLRRNIITSVRIGEKIVALDEDLGYLIGYFLGRGIITETASLRKVEIKTSSINSAKYLCRIVSNKLLLPCRVYFKKNTGNTEYKVVIYSGRFASWLKSHCFENTQETGRETLKQKIIPPLTLNAPLSFIKGVLLGLIESSGFITSLKATLFTTSEKLAYSIAAILAILGLNYIIKHFPVKREAETANYYEIIISDSNVIELIGYINKVKHERPLSVSNKIEVSGGPQYYETLILLKTRDRTKENYVNDLPGFSNIVNQEVGENNETYGALGNSSITWDTIESIEEVNINRIEPLHNKYVYDISVEDYENFVGGLGLIFLHNSQLLQYVARIAPRGIYTSGKGTTAAGLTAAVLRDKSTGEYYLEAGALVLGDGGVVCLHPETRVLVDDEYVRIADLFNEKRAIKALANRELVELNYSDHKVVGIELRSLRVKETLSNIVRRKFWKGKLVKLAFESGYELLLTPDHYLVDGEALVWKQASEFKPGDKVLSIQKIPGHEHEIYLFDIVPNTWTIILENKDKHEILRLLERNYGDIHSLRKALGKKIHVSHDKLYVEVGLFRDLLNKHGILYDWRKRILKFSRDGKESSMNLTKITPEIGYLMGLIYGRGHLTDGNATIVLPVKQKDILEKILKHLEVINVKPKLHTKTNTITSGDRDVNSKSIEVIIDSSIFTYLTKYFLEDSLRRIFKLPNSVLRGFLAGLMDASGRIYIKNRNRRQYETAYIGITFKNYTQAKAIPLVLRRFDIYSKIVRNSNSIEIQIINEDYVLKFVEIIKPYSIKAQKANIPIKKKVAISKSSIIPKKLTIRIANKIIKDVKPNDPVKDDLWGSIYKVIMGEAVLTKEKLREIASLYSQKLSPKTKEIINLATQYDYYVDKVVNIEYVEYEGYVYDLYVPGIHNFLAEGIIVHNCIDEIDKMRPEDRVAIHEAMEQGSISIAKAGIVAKLNARASILAAGNPVLGRYIPERGFLHNINLPPTILSRFDLMFVVTDVPAPERDEEMAEHILMVHKRAERVKPPIDPELLRKYIGYARKYVKPKLSDEAAKIIKDFFVSLRAKAATSAEVAVPITPRQLEALVRLAEAHARMALSNIVTAEDAKAAIDLMVKSFKDVGIDVETGEIDIDIIMTGKPLSLRKKMLKIMNIIEKLEEGVPGKQVNLRDVIEEAKREGISERDTEEIIEALRREGQIYMPREGKIARLL